MVIQEDGALQQSDHSYDRKVAGVVSGAGDFGPQSFWADWPVNEIGVAIALVGKVYCKVDARLSPIEVGG